MGKIIKTWLINQVWFALALWVMLVLGCGCSPKKLLPDPLVGWKVELVLEPSPAISKDYKDYIQKLPADEKKFVDDNSISLFKNENGQHAVKIEIPLDGTWWEHILFYDSENHRIKAMKYADGKYGS